MRSKPLSNIIYDRIPNSHFDVYIEQFGIEFSFIENPTNQNLREFLQFFDAKRIRTLIKTTKIPYDTELFKMRGIHVVELTFSDYFSDKDQLTDEKIISFIKIIREEKGKGNGIAIQSISGRSRPPMLLACALIVELNKTSKEANKIINGPDGAIKKWAITPDEMQFMLQLERRKIVID